MTGEPQEQQAVEEPQEPSRIAGGCVLVVAVGAAGGVVYAVPELGYFVAGLLATGTVRRARSWLDGRRAPADAEEQELEPVDIVGQLRDLSGGEHHVLLTRLAAAAGLTTATGRPDTKAVRQMLEEAGIRVRTGVRGPKPDGNQGNGPGVHLSDVPPAEGDTPAGRCLCRSDANANANNTTEEGPREGFRVEAIGQAGTVVHDPAEAHRRQTVPAK